MNKKSHSYIVAWAKKIRALNILGSRCSSCGEQRIWLLGFHHTDPNNKEFIVRDIKTYRWSIIEKEIKKCMVLCYNCHKEIHHIEKNTKSQINKKICLDFKQIHSCQKCGYDKCNESLEFHHIEGKDFPIGNFINNSKIFKSINDINSKLKKELEKCSLLCSNCHHEIHFDKEKFNSFKTFIDNYKYKENPKPVNGDYLIQLYKQGLNQKGISKKLSCTKSTVSTVLKKIMGGSLLKTTSISNLLNKKIENPKNKRHSKSLQEWIQFILDTSKKNPGECWIWPGRCNKYGYGSISFKDDQKYREISVHRLIYEHLRGKIPPGLLLCYTCDNHKCFNPDHLFLCTPYELGQHKIKKGKIFISNGEKSGVHKLTSEQVLSIRKDSRKLLEIAQSYNVAKSTISGIKNNKSRING